MPEDVEIEKESQEEDVNEVIDRMLQETEGSDEEEEEEEPSEKEISAEGKEVDINKLTNQIRQNLVKERDKDRKRLQAIVEEVAFTINGEKIYPVTFEELWEKYDSVKHVPVANLEFDAKNTRTGYLKALKAQGAFIGKTQEQKAEVKKQETEAKQEAWGKPSVGEVAPAVGKMTFAEAKEKGLSEGQIKEGIESGQIERTTSPTFTTLGDKK